MLRSPTKKKRVYGAWDPENMRKAITAVKSGYSPLRKAAEKYSVPSSTLTKRMGFGSQNPNYLLKMNKS